MSLEPIVRVCCAEDALRAVEADRTGRYAGGYHGDESTEIAAAVYLEVACGRHDSGHAVTGGAPPRARIPAVADAPEQGETVTVADVRTWLRVRVPLGTSYAMCEGGCVHCGAPVDGTCTGPDCPCWPYSTNDPEAHALADTVTAALLAAPRVETPSERRAADLIDDVDHDCPVLVGERAVALLEADGLRVVPATVPAALERVADVLELDADNRDPESVVVYSSKRSGSLTMALETVRRRTEMLRAALSAPVGTEHPVLIRLATAARAGREVARIREDELRERLGPCSDVECRLHLAHRGPHDTRPLDAFTGAGETR